MKPILDATQYEIERAICDKAQAYAERSMGGKRNYLTAEEAQHPDYAACNNDMRGRVEQYEILTNPPETLVAYIGKFQPHSAADAIASRHRGAYAVTVWTGLQIGSATVSSAWRVRSCVGSHMHQYTARIAGREYTGRGFGEGMAVVFRETATSKRKAAA